MHFWTTRYLRGSYPMQQGHIASLYVEVSCTNETVNYRATHIGRYFEDMPKVMKTKYVAKEVPADDYVVPRENQQIVKMLRCRGNNLYDVRDSSGKTLLVNTAATFRRTAWIRRGDFLLVEPKKEGSPVTAEIHRILFPNQVKYFREQGMWPEAFATEEEKGDSDKDSRDDDLFIFGIRPTVEDFDDRTTESYSSSKSEDQNAVYRNAK
ncbi:hypothetical protein HPB50_001409 [Hyalomma asiaticum]|uniref:Uncharacterized protein n=1 Tax=Hyalomma asiaticum TaxID=266040 RepID=A0ACB7RRB7_HYAAI|nr:hypothetical protein HPB50_001409 [Hyalomma asiaticum]